ncbi:MAG: TraR/DksA C4-type zinc finger protein [Endozoicomonadaceae bacterium]|nr:TraR/DksA C4-type zinc finger protein [Endozoicomonadaceae bacterium]
MNFDNFDTHELHQKLLQRKDELEIRVKNIKRDMTKKNSDDWSEQAQERSNDEVLNNLEYEAQIEIYQIQKALERIEHEEYAICTGCGCDIPLERLQIMPYTEYCIKCAEKQNNDR